MMNNSIGDKLVKNLFIIDEQKRYLYTPLRDLGPAYIIPDARTFNRERRLHIAANITLLITCIAAIAYSLWLALIPLASFFIWTHFYNHRAKKKWQALAQKPVNRAPLPPFSDSFPKPLLIGMIILSSPLVVFNTITLFTNPSLNAAGFFIFSLVLFAPAVLILRQKLKIENSRTK